MREPPVCPMPPWMERALARPAVALTVSIMAWGMCGLIWGYLALDLAVEVLLHILLAEVPA